MGRGKANRKSPSQHSVGKAGAYVVLDKNLIPRLESYADNHSLEDTDTVADALRAAYKEYQRRPLTPFRKMVQRAINAIQVRSQASKKIRDYDQQAAKAGGSNFSNKGAGNADEASSSGSDGSDSSGSSEEDDSSSSSSSSSSSKDAGFESGEGSGEAAASGAGARAMNASLLSMYARPALAAEADDSQRAGPGPGSTAQLPFAGAAGGRHPTPGRGRDSPAPKPTAPTVSGAGAPGAGASGGGPASAKPAVTGKRRRSSPQLGRDGSPPAFAPPDVVAAAACRALASEKQAKLNGKHGGPSSSKAAQQRSREQGTRESSAAAAATGGDAIGLGSGPKPYLVLPSVDPPTVAQQQQQQPQPQRMGEAEREDHPHSAVPPASAGVAAAMAAAAAAAQAAVPAHQDAGLGVGVGGMEGQEAMEKDGGTCEEGRSGAGAQGRVASVPQESTGMATPAAKAAGAGGGGGGGGTGRQPATTGKKGRRAAPIPAKPQGGGGLGGRTGGGQSSAVTVARAVSYTDLGGVEDVLAEIRELIEYPLKHPEVYAWLGVEPPRGVLLHGPPGCGKTALANAIANECGVPFLRVSAPEIVSGMSGESEAKLRSLFQEAADIAPCIVFIDEIDAIAPKRETAQREMERRIVAQMLTCMDDLTAPTPASKDGDQPDRQEAPPVCSRHVVVIGATNRPDALDPALRRAGRFDREIALGIPSEAARMKILQVITQRLRLEGNFDFKRVAKRTPGFVGADLMALVKEAAALAVTRIFSTIDDGLPAHLSTQSAHPPPTPTGPKEATTQCADAGPQDGPYIAAAAAAPAAAAAVPAAAAAAADAAPGTAGAEGKAPVSCKPPSIDMDTDRAAGGAAGTQAAGAGVAASAATQCGQGELDDGRACGVGVEYVPSEPAAPVGQPGMQAAGMGTLVPISGRRFGQGPLQAHELQGLAITMADFEAAVAKVQPSVRREGFATTPDVTWEDVGSLDEVREELSFCITQPIMHPERFQALGMSAATGVLLYGPPGCGKTLVAKAVAHESGANFMSIKGPELLNKYVGESERAVRQLFSRARAAHPCVLFFDELDALAPRRGTDSNQAAERVVNQLLTEMDGIDGRLGVFLVAATNRPDMIDPALLRPGRLDKILYVPLPPPNGRASILKALVRNTPLAPGVDIEAIGLSTRCSGFSGADMAALVREACVLALKESMRAAAVGSSRGLGGDAGSGDGVQRPYVHARHFEAALGRVVPSVSRKDQRCYDQLRSRLRSSRGRLEVADDAGGGGAATGGLSTAVLPPGNAPKHAPEHDPEHAQDAAAQPPPEVGAVASPGHLGTFGGMPFGGGPAHPQAGPGARQGDDGLLPTPVGLC